MPDRFTLRSGTLLDRFKIDKLIDSAKYFHHHLDWRTPSEWLGKNPFFVKENLFGIYSALACSPEPEGIGWIRLFTTSRISNLIDDWQSLFSKTLEYFQEHPVQMLPAMSIHAWFSDLLIGQGFQFLQDVVVLKWDRSDQKAQASDFISIRLMNDNDLPIITEVDHLAFEPLWQIPLSALNRAFKQSAHATVACINDRIVGYQLSTSKHGTAHLARLAVLPEYQGQSIGLALTRQMLSHFSSMGIAEITVNTQNDNKASLALYKKMNFHPTGENYPVYNYPT
jgi:ribosomal protein S18 acetylase RimI-like enzyme